MEEVYDDLRYSAAKCIKSERLDRHKLAACICWATIAGKPLVYRMGYKVKINNLNENFAVHMGLAVLKTFLIFDTFNGRKDLSSSEQSFKNYIIDNFDMEFPPIEENICDKTTYETNLVNALSRINKCFKNNDIPCGKFDIWAYSKIFYHLDIHNTSRFKMFKVKYDYTKKHRTL